MQKNCDLLVGDSTNAILLPLLGRGVHNWAAAHDDCRASSTASRNGLTSEHVASNAAGVIVKSLLKSSSDDAVAVPVATVGHKSTHVTETVYRHVIAPAIRGGAQVMDSVFGEEDDEPGGPSALVTRLVTSVRTRIRKTCGAKGAWVHDIGDS